MVGDISRGLKSNIYYPYHDQTEALTLKYKRQFRSSDFNSSIISIKYAAQNVLKQNTIIFYFGNNNKNLILPKISI